MHVVRPPLSLLLSLSGAAVVALAAVCAACGATKGASRARRAADDAGDPRTDFRPTAWEAFSHVVDPPKPYVVRDLLCVAREPERCADACLGLPPRDAAHCALDHVYHEDEEARSVARELLARTGAVPGIEQSTMIDAAHLGNVPIEPVLPVGPYRRHLVWLRDALIEIDGTFAEIARAAPRPVHFRTRPYGFRFFKTSERSYPSAYAFDGIVGYNVEGPLHETPESVAATLLHELFHLNDEGHGDWTQVALVGVFEGIVRRCGDDHDCFTPYSPEEDRVDGGTYYAFDPRTRDVREYGAELALRWYREHRAALGVGAPSTHGPFKCATEENAEAWRQVTSEFFGGLDLTPPCGGEAP